MDDNGMKTRSGDSNARRLLIRIRRSSVCAAVIVGAGMSMAAPAYATPETPPPASSVFIVSPIALYPGPAPLSGPSFAAPRTPPMPPNHRRQYHRAPTAPQVLPPTGSAL